MALYSELDSDAQAQLVAAYNLLAGGVVSFKALSEPIASFAAAYSTNGVKASLESLDAGEKLPVVSAHAGALQLTKEEAISLGDAAVQIDATIQALRATAQKLVGIN